MSKAPALLFALIVALAVAAGTVLTLGGRPDAAEEARGREFQRLVGGLGFGPALDLERCAFSFDPRLCPACPNDCGPIPCGMCFCPYHACSLRDFPALSDKGEGLDALLP
jgi:hypothetical protein